MAPRLRDGLVERQPRTGEVLLLVGGTEALAGTRHQALVALPLGEEHPEAEPPLLVLRDSPEAGRRAVMTLLQQCAPDAGDAVDLHSPASGRDGVVERFGKAVQRLDGIPAIQREVPEAVQRACQLLVEAELSCARHRLLEPAPALVEGP